MLSTNVSTLGIVFPNDYDRLLPDLTNKRAMGSLPFGGRYRMIDFTLSSMSNSGISNIFVLVNRNYHSLMDHLGAGREWDLSRKNGGLKIIPPFAKEGVEVYNGKVDALAGICPTIEYSKEKYVLLCDSNIAMNIDFSDFVQKHIESGADVSMLYQTVMVPEAIKEMNHTFQVDGEKVTEIYTNDNRPGMKNLSMNIYVMEREKLIELVKEAKIRNLVGFETDILARNLASLKVRAVRYDGYAARICDMQSYFEENMRLLAPENCRALFGGSDTIYTKIRDDAPTRYAMDCRVKNSLVADGCIIEGTVEDSVLFRGVHVAKGAVVKHCVLMQDTVVNTGASVEYVITDKYVKIGENKKLLGADTHAVFVAKNTTV